MKIRIPTLAALLGSVLSLSSCSGKTGGMVSGTVVKGAVSGAAVTAYAITNGTTGAQVGSGTSNATGNFNVLIGDYAGPLLLQASGGTYTDEATGAVMTLQPGDVMVCVVSSVGMDSTTTGIQITPLTSMAHAMANGMAGGMTAANITAANAAVGGYFSVGDILHTMPMDPLVTSSGNTATPDMRNYGMAIAAMSQYALGIGMPASSGIVTAVTEDASDGVMDGKAGTIAVTLGGGMPPGTTMQPTAGTTGLGAAMSTFVGSARNQSGVPVSTMQPLIDKLNASNGAIQ